MKQSIPFSCFCINASHNRIAYSSTFLFLFTKRFPLFNQTWNFLLFCVPPLPFFCLQSSTMGLPYLIRLFVIHVPRSRKKKSLIRIYSKHVFRAVYYFITALGNPPRSGTILWMSIDIFVHIPLLGADGDVYFPGGDGTDRRAQREFGTDSVPGMPAKLGGAFFDNIAEKGQLKIFHVPNFRRWNFFRAIW